MIAKIKLKRQDIIVSILTAVKLGYSIVLRNNGITYFYKYFVISNMYLYRIRNNNISEFAIHTFSPKYLLFVVTKSYNKIHSSETNIE